MKVTKWAVTRTLYTQLCVLVSPTGPALCDPMDCSHPGSSVYGVLQEEYWNGEPFPSPGGIFPTQGSNRGLLHCKQIPYCLSHQGSSLIQLGSAE